MFNRNLLRGSCFLYTFVAMKQVITHGHDYVEIGGIKWATMNVGAKDVTDGGLYFAWGETKGYSREEVGKTKRFILGDYKLGGTKYNSKDKLKTLQPQDDPVHVNWRGNWRLPTREEFKKLKKATTSEWVDNYKGSGVNGLFITDKNDASKQLFFPAVGLGCYGSVLGVGSSGNYWSSSLDNSYPTYGWHLSFDGGDVTWDGGSNRGYGFCARGVLDW